MFIIEGEGCKERILSYCVVLTSVLQTIEGSFEILYSQVGESGRYTGNLWSSKLAESDKDPSDAQACVESTLMKFTLKGALWRSFFA